MDRRRKRPALAALGLAAALLGLLAFPALATATASAAAEGRQVASPAGGLAAAPTGKVSGYGFFWESGLSGYGGYQAWAADINGDRITELVVQAAQGESEDGSPVTLKLAIYRRFSLLYEGPAPGIGVCAVVDINGDKRAEVLTADGLAYGWSADKKALESLPGLAAPMEQWLQANYLPVPVEGETIVDFDGDGTLDVVSRELTGLRLTSKTRGEFVLAFPPGIGEPRYHIWFPRLPGGERAVFTDSVVYNPTALHGPVGPGFETVYWTLWRTGPDGNYLKTSAAPYPAIPRDAFQMEPAVAFADLDADGVDELVTNDKGVILIYRWSGDMYDIAWESPNNGGLGYGWFTTAELNGDGTRELVARLVTPKQGLSTLKIYRIRAGNLEGLADVEGAGGSFGGGVVVSDLLGLDSEQLVMGHSFEMCRASALGLNVDLAQLPPAKVGIMGRLSGAWTWTKHTIKAVLRRPLLALGVGGLGLCMVALVAVVAVRRGRRRGRAPSSPAAGGWEG